MDRHNAWDFETQYRQILFKLKLEDFHLKVKNLSGGAKAFVARHHFNKPP
jgi:ATP-binding cassette subfamily F protein uup